MRFYRRFWGWLRAFVNLRHNFNNIEWAHIGFDRRLEAMESEDSRLAREITNMDTAALAEGTMLEVAQPIFDRLDRLERFVAELDFRLRRLERQRRPVKKGKAK